MNDTHSFRAAIALVCTLLGVAAVPAQADVFVWEGMEPIPDVNPVGAVVEILVPGDGGPIIIDDLDVDTIIEHTFQGDVIVEVTHVNSTTSAQLMHRPADPEFPGGFSVPNIGDPFTFEDFLFDDEAALPYDFPFVGLPGMPNVTGAWLPTGDPLSIFDGLDATGIWQLRVIDEGPGGAGFVRRFSLHITEPCQPPAFIQPLEAQTLCVGDTLILDAQVSGTGPFTYDWCFEDICGFVPSAPTLQIDDIALNEGGTYSVDVFGACGIVSSGAVQIDVTQRCKTEPPECPPAAPHAACACVRDVHDIYAFSGEFHTTVVDFEIPGRGMDFVWSRKYRSQVDTGFTRFANQWDFSYDIRIVPQGSSFLIWDGNARKDHFTLQPDGTWKSDEFFRVLEQNQACSRPENNNCYALTFEDTSQWRFFGFDSLFLFQLESIVDRNGNTMLFDYHPTFGTLNKVTDTLGREIDIAYNADGKIASVTDFAGRQVTYAYYQNGDAGGSFGDLKSVTTPLVVPDPQFTVPAGHEYPLGKTTVYTYTKDFADDRLNHNLLTMTDPKGQTILVNEYDPTQNPADLGFDRLVRQTLGDPGDIIDFVYVPQVPDAANNFAVIRAIVNDRVGNVGESFFDALNRVVIHRQFTGRADPDVPTTDVANRPINPLRPDDPAFFETRYEWNEDSMCTRLVLPNLNEVQKVFDSNNDSQRSQGNLLQRCIEPGDLSGDQDMICELFEYDDDFGGCCGSNFVIRHTDPRGNDAVHEYDGNGNRTHTTHRIPSIVEDFEYNQSGQLTLHIHPDNGSGHRRRDEFTYHDSGPQLGYRSAQIIDEDGFALTTTYEYDIVGNLTRTTDPRAHDRELDYNQLNQVVRQRSPEVEDGSAVRYQRESFYDPNDNVIRIDIENKDDSGLVDPTNPILTTTYEYDILNYMTRQTQEVNTADDIVTELEFDDNRNQTLERLGEATNGNDSLNIIRTLYDERDLEYHRIRADSSAQESTTQTDYDGNGNIKAIREGLQDTPRVTLNTYDGYDRLFVSIDPMGNRTEFHYDPNGNQGGEKDPQSQPGVLNPFGLRIQGELNDIEGDADNIRLYEVTYEYDIMNRMTRQITEFFDTETQVGLEGGRESGKAIEDVTYSDSSQETSRTNDNNHIIVTAYDTANRVAVVTDPKGNTKARQYDPNDNILIEIEVDKSDLLNPDQEFTTTYAYDNLNRMTRVIDNVGNISTSKFDSRDNHTLDIDELGLETRYVYDGINRMTRTIYDMDSDGADGDGADIVTIKLFDDSSRLIHEEDDNNNITFYAYDSMNRMTTVTYADNTTREYFWDVHDNLTSELDANGTMLINTYDLLNRLMQRTVDRASVASGDPVDVVGTTFELFGYDGLSRTVTAVDDDSVVVRQFDSLSNTTLETVNDTHTTTSVYDGMGNQVSCVYPGGREVHCTYNELERKKTVVDAGSGGTLAAYHYVGPVRVERSDLGNGTRVDLTYDGISGIPNAANDFGVKHIASTVHSRVVDGAIIDARSYAWNQTYHKVQREDIRDAGPQLTHDYVYDSIYRLTRTIATDTVSGVRDTTYVLDGVNNRAEVIGEPDPGTYVLDPGGDLQTNRYTSTPFENRDHDPNGNLTLQTPGSTMSYDYRNLMVDYVDTDLGQTHHYVYDPFGRRLQSTVNFGEGGGGIHYLYDGDRVIEEQDDLGDTLATYVYGSYIDEVITMQRDTNNDAAVDDFYYHCDDMYNVMALTRGSTVGAQWNDDLNIYAAGPLVGLGGWAPWDDNPEWQDFEVSTVEFLSAPNSVAIDAPDDAVRLYSGFDSGIAVYSAWQYIPFDFDSGGAGALDGTYFILLNTYNPGGPYHWSVQMRFDSNNGMVEVFHGDGNNTINVPYETDRWVKIQAVIDLDNDWTQVYYDDNLITEYPWTGGILGDGGGVLDIAAVDLYANNSSVVYYDDLRLERFDDGLPGTVAERYEYGDFGLPEYFNCPPDQDGNAATDAADLAQLLGAWGPNPGHPADINNDGVVNEADLNLLVGDWGACVEPQPLGNPYLSNGRRLDPETGLYHYRTRYMDPRAGRFTTRDSIGIWGDAGNLGNGYTYVGNDPLSALDPYGMIEGTAPGVFEYMGHKAVVRHRNAMNKQPSMCAGFKPKTGMAHFWAMMFDPQYVFCYRRSFGGTATPALPKWPVDLRSDPPPPPPPRPVGPSHFSGPGAACMTRCLAAKPGSPRPGEGGGTGLMRQWVAECRKKCTKPKGPSGPTAPTPPPPTPPAGPCKPTGGTVSPRGPGGPTGPTGPLRPFDDPHWNDPVPPGTPTRLPLGHGKMKGYACVDASCQVVTRAGPRRIGDIRIGDEVLTPDGRFRRVVDKDFGGVWAERLGDYVEIKTTAGSIIITRDHVIGGKPAGAWRDGEHMTMHNGDVLTVAVQPAAGTTSGDLRLEGETDYITSAGFVVGSMMSRYLGAGDVTGMTPAPWNDPTRHGQHGGGTPPEDLK